MKVASNVSAAQDAASGFTAIHADTPGQRASLGSSNIAGMKDGVGVANEVLKIISDLVSGMKRQADNVTALAKEIEDRDKRDAGIVGGKK